MTTASYAHACRNLAQELLESLSSAEIKALREWLSGLTRKQWYGWLEQYERDIYAFVSATPSERLRRKAWQEPAMRLPLTLAAWHHVQQAAAVLDAIDQHGLHPGGSWRSMAAEAGEAYWEILGRDIPFWPFPGKCRLAD